jgi:hypothetical protein
LSSERWLELAPIPTVTFAFTTAPVAFPSGDALVKVLSKNLPGGSWAIVATANLHSLIPGSSDRISTCGCELRNGNAVVGGATDRRVIPEGDRVLISLSMNGGAQVPAGGGEVSLHCHSQNGNSIDSAQMMMIQVGGFS